MASTKKTRILNKRFSRVNESSPDKDGGSANKSRLKKRKLPDALGSHWSKEELERFYEAYRKYGKDWKKVASAVRNRSADMVEALYNANRLFLSLPEGSASVAGLIALMTDHYNLLGGSDSERESNDGLGISSKPQKRGRGKFRYNSSKGSDAPFPDLLQYQSMTSNYGCLSLLKKPRSGCSRPRAVGKRTPRFPVYVKDNRADIVSPDKEAKSNLDATNDEVAHVAALALAEASQRGGSPQLSRTPSKRAQSLSPVQNGKRKAELEMASAKDEDCLEGSSGSREAENGDSPPDNSYPLDKGGNNAVEIRQRVKKFQGKKSKVQWIENNHIDDVREACSGTEEGLALRTVKDEIDTEVTDGGVYRSPPQGPRKRSRQLIFEDESFALDALHALADLSVNILSPSTAIDSESSVRVKEEKRNVDGAGKRNLPGSTSTNHQKDRTRISVNKVRGNRPMAGADVSVQKSTKLGKDLSLELSATSEGKQQPDQSGGKVWKKKRKSSAAKAPKAEKHGDSHFCESQKTEVSADDGNKNKGKHVSQIGSLPKQGKSVGLLECTSSTYQGRTGVNLAVSTVQVSPINQVNLPTKLRSRRKMDIPKVLKQKHLRSSESAGNEQPDRYSLSLHNRAVDFKSKLSHCLSSDLLRRWCTFEWFYSAIDYPWFARSEFVEYLNHVGLGHIPRLTRVEWGVIRSSLGKPRRLSKQFLREEREKLERYRESVRTHYTELRAGIRDGLATDLARPLSVGQRVIACHPRTREIHDGSVLTVDRNRCRVQFDQPELGVEFVMDIDCMPLDPLESLSEALRRQNAVVHKFYDSFNELKVDSQLKDLKIGGSLKSVPGDSLENVDGLSHAASSNYIINTLMKQAKGDTLDEVVQAKAAASEAYVVQANYSQACTLAQIQARDADIRALSDLKRALDKKEALLLELSHMNDEELGNQKGGDVVKDENCRKQYAMVLVQLKDINEQVASALSYLRQRNTYRGNTSAWLGRSIANLGGSIGPQSPFDLLTFLTHDSGSHVVEIVESSNRKARTMVDAAMQVMSSLKDGEDAFVRIGEVLDSASSWQSGRDSSVPEMKSFSLQNSGHCGSAFQDQATSCVLETVPHAPSAKQNTSGDEVQHPSELISSCVAALLMIKMCTERQYPPAEVAQILDYAVTRLQPCCSQNLPIYREIQQCMGIVKTQMLALIPTQTNGLQVELPPV